LIHDLDNSRSPACDITGMASIVRGPDNTAESNPAMIAIDRYRIVVGNSILGQIALDLGYQQVIFRALGGRLVMMSG
jgi:hypothetical protein